MKSQKRKIVEQNKPMHIEFDDEEQDNVSQLEVFAHNYKLGQDAIEELALLKPVLALAISKLPKKQLKLSLSDMATLHELDLQYKAEGKSGAIMFRAVKA